MAGTRSDSKSTDPKSLESKSPDSKSSGSKPSEPKSAASKAPHSKSGSVVSSIDVDLTHVQGILRHPAFVCAVVLICLFFGPLQPLTVEEKNKLVQSVLELQNKKLEKYAKADTVKAVEKSFQLDIQELDKQQQELQEEVDKKLIATTEKISKSVNKVTTTVDDMSSSVTELQEELRHSRKTIADLAGEIATLQTKSDQSEKTMEQLQDELTESKEELERIVQRGTGAEQERREQAKLNGTTPAINWALSSLGTVITDSSSYGHNRGFWTNADLNPLRFVMSTDKLVSLQLQTSAPITSLLSHEQCVPGQAFAMPTPGFVQIRLGVPIKKVTHVGLRHLTVQQTPNKKSAPKIFRVLKVESEKENTNSTYSNWTMNVEEGDSTKTAALDVDSTGTEKSTEEMASAVASVVSSGDLHFKEELGFQLFPVSGFDDVRELKFEFLESYGAKTSEKEDFVTLFRLEVYGEKSEGW